MLEPSFRSASLANSRPTLAPVDSLARSPTASPVTGHEAPLPSMRNAAGVGRCRVAAEDEGAAAELDLGAGDDRVGPEVAGGSLRAGEWSRGQGCSEGERQEGARGCPHGARRPQDTCHGTIPSADEKHREISGLMACSGACPHGIARPQAGPGTRGPELLLRTTGRRTRPKLRAISRTRLALMHPSGVQESPPPFGRTRAALWGGLI